MKLKRKPGRPKGSKTKKRQRLGGTKPKPQEKFRKQRGPGRKQQMQAAEPFITWLEDIKPRALTAKGKYEAMTWDDLTDDQREAALAFFCPDTGGNERRHSIVLSVAPRRHGKSLINALLALYHFDTVDHHNTVLLGSTEQHTRRTMYNQIKRIVIHTPKLKERIPEKRFYLYHASHPHTEATIELAGVNVSASFGEKVNLLWVSDLHAHADLAPWNALQASLLDSEGSMILIDSNVDAIDGPVHELQKLSTTDTGVYSHHRFYNSMHHFKYSAPEWINRDKAKRLEKTTLPADFRRDVLGQRSSASNALFPPEVIERCKSQYKTPVVDLEAITQGREYKIGGGLDRAKSLIGGPNSDRTVWTVIAKVAMPDGEPEYFILNQHVFTVNTSKNIKAKILEDHERYNLDSVILENYEVSDLYSWLCGQDIPVELISATDSAQNASFPELHRISKEGRLHSPETLTTLTDEMSTFIYTSKRPGHYSFGHATRKQHDDCVYSLNWSIFALRQQILDLYILGGIDCESKSPNKHLCFLMGGNLQLSCAEECYSFHRVHEMYRQFCRYQDLDSELTIPEFYKTYVRTKGVRLSQAV